MLNNYEKYITMLNEKLEKFFISQAPYIFCKKGCAKCCRNAQYPFSKIEYEYLMSGFRVLTSDLKLKVLENIKIVIEQEEFSEKPYTYVCPFLINEECCVYHYRGIMCRTFGLLTVDKSGGSDVPFCALDGLNYSNVFDYKHRKISSDMYKILNTNIEPVAYNIGYDYLTDKDFEIGYGFEFGEVKPLIDWLKLDTTI